MGISMIKASARYCAKPPRAAAQLTPHTAPGAPEDAKKLPTGAFGGIGMAYWISRRRALETVCCFLGMVRRSTPSVYSALMALSSMPLTSKERWKLP